MTPIGAQRIGIAAPICVIYGLDPHGLAPF